MPAPMCLGCGRVQRKTVKACMQAHVTVLGAPGGIPNVECWTLRQASELSLRCTPCAGVVYCCVQAIPLRWQSQGAAEQRETSTATLLARARVCSECAGAAGGAAAVMATAPSLLVLLGAAPARHLPHGCAVPPCSASDGGSFVVASATRGARAPAGLAARGAGGRLAACVSTAHALRQCWPCMHAARPEPADACDGGSHAAQGAAPCTAWALGLQCMRRQRTWRRRRLRACAACSSGAARLARGAQWGRWRWSAGLGLQFLGWLGCSTVVAHL